MRLVSAALLELFDGSLELSFDFLREFLLGLDRVDEVGVMRLQVFAHAAFDAQSVGHGHVVVGTHVDGVKNERFFPTWSGWY